MSVYLPAVVNVKIIMTVENMMLITGKVNMNAFCHWYSK